MPLAEKLLSEIVSKYSPSLTMNATYLSKLEKKQMITEIRMLSKALIRSEKQIHKAGDKHRATVKNLKNELSEYEFKLQNSIRKQQKTQQEVAELVQQVKALEEQIAEREKEMRYTYEKYDSAREQYSNDKRELLVKLEREKQEYMDREQSRFQQRISSI
jgi:chromosome segregation ATPase